MISDLGAVTCKNGSYGAICSPLHAVMNLSFIVQGLLISGGAFLLKSLFPTTRPLTVAFSFLVVAGPSLTAVGLVPEDVGSPLHGIAAGVHLLSGNLGMILFGISQLEKVTGKITLAMGITGLTAILLLGFHQYSGIGPGAMERIGGYPLPLWLTGMGIYLLIIQPEFKGVRA